MALARKVQAINKTAAMARMRRGIWIVFMTVNFILSFPVNCNPTVWITKNRLEFSSLLDIRLFVVFHAVCSEFAGFVSCGEFLDETVNIAVHYACKIVVGQANAMIGNAALRVIVGADLF